MRPPEAWSVARTMQALEALAFQPLSAPQVAAALQIHPRTARRLLTRLHQEGYLTRTDDARRLYSPTMRIVSLAAQVIERAELATAAVPFVARLHDLTGATAHFCVPSYRSVLCVVHGHDGAAPEPGLNELVPCHCTATGKALLSHRHAWRESVLRTPLQAHTQSTVTDPAAVRAEADLTRRRGYAVERDELRPGVSGVAAPVFGPGGDPLAAIGVSTDEPIEPGRLADAVVPIAQDLTEVLGG